MYYLVGSKTSCTFAPQTKRNVMYHQKEVEKLFTVDRGLEVQATQLAEWERILKPELYELLQEHIADCNSKQMETGYNVFRGSEIDNWVHNELMMKIKSKPATTKKQLMFNITVRRTSYSYCTLNIWESDLDVAKQRALDIAGGYEFSEDTTEYEIAELDFSINLQKK